MQKRGKKFPALMMGILLLSYFPNHVQAEVPLSLALELSSQTMTAGESMEVAVSLQNYDENYTDNVITTMIVEVSVDTEQLSVDEESIDKDFDAGGGMGFSTVHMSDGNNVELQYLNIGDPLAKGTEKLLHFTVTANQEITDLTEAVKITYAVMQDGTETESVKLTVVPFTMVNGETVEQGTIGEQYTSEYGTIAAANVTNSLTGSDSSENTANTGDSSQEESSANSGDIANSGNSANTGDSSENGNAANSGDSTNTGSSGGSSQNTENVSGDNSEETAAADGYDSENPEKETDSEKTGASADETKNTAKKNALVGLVPGIILMAVVAGAVYFVRKRKGR